MTKAKSQSTPAQAAPEKTKRSSLKTFVHHQGKALEETGKAFAALLPTGFRTHAVNALEESRTSWEALFDGLIDTVESGLDKLRSEPKAPAPVKEKIEVE